jgi:Transcription- and export-related complex subunit
MTKGFGPHHLAKITHAAPLHLHRVLTKLEPYGNFVPHLTDAIKFVSPLSFDVLSWLLVERLGEPGRPVTGDSGMHTSLWLLNLAHFSGCIYKTVRARRRRRRCRCCRRCCCCRRRCCRCCCC